MSSMDVDVLCRSWRKATYSINNGQCVEVASARAAVLVRDSVNPAGPVVSYSSRTWHAFLASAKAGVFDTAR